MGKKVMVAMSGGVDSSAAALLLKQQGFEAVGITMCLGIKDAHDITAKPRCCGTQAINDARRVCDRLGIAHYIMDFAEHLEKKVIASFIDQYRRGRTPNPCVECNRWLKFDILLNKALSLGFDYLATGHYAAISEQEGGLRLERPKDRRKDQTYFLYPIRPESLEHILFPLAGFTKEEVRALARDNGLPVADKLQSQDICFIPDGDYREFLLGRKIIPQPGDIVDCRGTVLGQHRGVCFYTIGQREGLGISAPHPLYVVDIDAEQNRITVAGKEHLRSKGLIAGEVNRFSEKFPEKVEAKIRYAHKAAACAVSFYADKARVVFNETQEAITPGQSVVFYYNNTVLGGGVIEEVIAQERQGAG